MGQQLSHVYEAYIASPETRPDYNNPPVHDPLYGFSEGRIERRKPNLTEEEMEAIGIDPKMRDYCADLLVPYYKCRRDWYPWVAACKHELHEWKHCQYEDYILRMKEYERERRLKARDLRKKAKANVDSGEDIVHSEAQVH